MKLLLLDIETAPNISYTWGLYKCGSDNFQHRGFATTNMMKYRRYQCKDCGGWFRSNKTVSLRREERMTNIAA